MSRIISNYDVNLNNLRINGGKLKIVIRDRLFNYNSIMKIVASIDKICSLNYTCSLYINVKSEGFIDDASLMMLENIIYDALVDKNIDIQIHFDNLRAGTLGYACYIESILNRSIINNVFNRNNFIKLFKTATNIKGNILRKYLKYEDSLEHKTKNTQSLVVQDVYYFLNHLDFTTEYSQNIAVASSEIIDNVFSHAKSDAILSIKVIDVVNREKIRKKAVSVCILNLSNTLLYSAIKEKYFNKTLEEKSHTIVSKSYNNNVAKFNEKFDENSFWFTSVFQKYVTSRTKTNGGTGLTTLIKNLIDKSYDDFCYVISGDNCLFFKKELLKLNEDGTIGFNSENDYFNNIPDETAIIKNNYFLKGTLFSLMFIS